MCPVVVPVLLSAAYLVLLVLKFPHLLSWENTDSDVASAYVLADAISHGHTGHVVMSTQGSWVPLWYGLLTHGLSFHRLLWELSPAVLTLAAACLIGWSVARIATRGAAALTVALILAASPTALVSFTAAFLHNTTWPGVALLGAYLVWLSSRRHRGGVVAASIIALSLIIGTFLASDELLLVAGLLPFLAVSLLAAVKAREYTVALPAILVTIGSAVAAAVTSKVMHSLGFVTTTPHPMFAPALVGEHLKWLLQGLLRMGNGSSLAPQASIRMPLTIAAAIVTVSALGASAWVAGRAFARRGGGPARAKDLHVMFWFTSLVFSAAAYVTTAVALMPSDRYFLVAIPAVAATVPLLLTSRRASWLTAAGAAVFIAASIVALAANDSSYGTYRGVVARQVDGVEALVASQHLTIGYAGYWDAASLDWTSHERLHVYPLTNVNGITAPMRIARVSAWYRPRPGTPSYLLLAPGDNVFADWLPQDLPKPRREFHVGQITIAVYPYDLASYLHAPVN